MGAGTARLAAGKRGGLPLSCLPCFHEGKRGVDTKGKSGGRGRELRDGPALPAAVRRGPTGGGPLQDESAAAQPGADKAALIEGILDGTIDLIATDHAPHTAAEKSRGLAGSAMGVVGLETAFPALYTGLVKGILGLPKLMELLSTAPRKVFGARREDRNRCGAAADLCGLGSGCGI